MQGGRMVLGILFTVLVLLILFFLWVAAYDGNRFVTTEYTIREERLPKDVTIAFLTDLHDHAYGQDNERLLDAINTLSPDLILVGGDMINARRRRFSGKYTDFQNSLKLLKALSARYPVYHGDGNHEYRAFENGKLYRGLWDAYKNALKETDIHYLRNETDVIKDLNIAVTGFSMDLDYYRKFRERKFPEGYMDSLIGKKKNDCFHILLAHNPEYFPEYVGWDPDLVLSGHVHGGVMRLPRIGGVIAPSLRIFPHYDGGLFEEYGHRMILGRGLGMHSIPIRIFNPGELVCIRLRSGKDNEAFDVKSRNR